MVIVLPVHAEFYSKNYDYQNRAINMLPGDLSELAYLVLLSDFDLETFINYAKDLIMNICDNDDGIDPSVHLILWSDSFDLFLDMFFEIHTRLYSILLGDYTLSRFDIIDYKKKYLLILQVEELDQNYE